MGYIEIKNLRKTYGAVEVLKGIDLRIAEGEFVSLLGASGSGKTTILRCLAGLETPDITSGELLLDGTVLSGPKKTFVKPEHRKLGMVFQNYAVWPHMNVAANVSFPLNLRRDLSQNEKQKRTQDALKLVKLDTLAHRFAHELSGGQQQRVALARALAMSPKALLLDEPLSNLDAVLRDELGSEIRRLQRELGLTTILVTHDQKEALSLSDRIILLDNGSIDSEGSPESLYLSPTTDFSARFIAGGQQMRLHGEERMVIPRRWRIIEKIARSATDNQADNPTDNPVNDFPKNVPPSAFTVTSRTFLGSEYEYRAEGESASLPVRFFSNARLEIGSNVTLQYPGSRI